MALGNLGRGMSEDELQEAQEQMQREQENRQQAQQLAGQFAGEQQIDKTNLIQMVQDLGLEGEVEQDHLEDFFAAELAPIIAISDLTPGDINRMDWRSEQQFWTAKNEFKDSDSSLESDDMRMMYGEDRTELSDRLERRRRSAEEIKKYLIRLARNSSFRRSMTEIRAVSETTQRDEGDDDSGSLMGWLSG